MRFIHIADIHLGLEPDAGKPWSERRKKDLWNSFVQVFEKAEQEKVDLLLIAGDLFHRQPLVKELKEFSYLCGKLSHTKVVLIAGNHDYMKPNSNYSSFEFPENVYFLKGNQIEQVEFKELQTVVYGMSYWSREIKEAVYDSLRPEDAGKINILLAHGGDAKHIPVSGTALRKSGFDYIAMGHIHKGGQIEKNRIVMAGSLEPTDCNDIGPHGYWMGELSKKNCQLMFHPIKNCEYVEYKFDITDMATKQEIIDKLKQDLTKKMPYQIYKVELIGKCSPELDITEEDIAELPGVAAASIHVIPNYDFEKLKQDYRHQLLGKYIEELEAMPQNTTTQKALYYGVDALYRSME